MMLKTKTQDLSTPQWTHYYEWVCMYGTYLTNCTILEDRGSTVIIDYEDFVINEVVTKEVFKKYIYKRDRKTKAY